MQTTSPYVPVVYSRSASLTDMTCACILLVSSAAFLLVAASRGANKRLKGCVPYHITLNLQTVGQGLQQRMT